MIDKQTIGLLMEIKLNNFNKRVVDGMKCFFIDGLYTHSPFWTFAKRNLILQSAKIEKVGLNFTSDHTKTWLFFSKLFPFNNNKALIFLNSILNLKSYFKTYYTIYGHKIWIRPRKKMNDILNDYQRLKVWEAETTAIIEREVKRGDMCVDVGASIGYFTLLFSRLVGPTGKVIAIEPTDFQQPYLKKNIKKNGYENIVTQVHCGAWDKDEIIKMPLSAPAYCQFELRCRPVDDILEELGIMKVDFIKVDVDGPEPNVLKGLIRTIERSPNMKMVIEFYPKYIISGGCSVEDFKTTINKYFNTVIIPGDYSEGCWNLYCTRK